MHNYLIFFVIKMSSTFLFSTFSSAETAFDPLIGIRTGQAVTNSILASPPLPGISREQEGTQYHLSPQVSYILVRAENNVQNDEKMIPTYSGDFTGNSIAIGYTRDSQTRLSYFGFITYSKANGKIMESPSGFGTTLENMSSSSINFSAGVSLRFWSERQFPVVIGLLAGPFISKHSSRLTATFRDPSSSDSSSNSSNQYSSESFIYGPMLGVQAYFKISSLAFNPYFLYYKDLSSPCQTFETDATIPEGQGWIDSAKSCNADNKEIYLDGTFSAFGLNVGYRKLLFGVFSKANDDEALSSIKVQRYTVSYTLDF